MPGAPELGLGLGNKSVEEGRRMESEGEFEQSFAASVESEKNRGAYYLFIELGVRKTKEPAAYL
ncbi:hypothetical protein M6B38_248265 [Iris pallida]|uniref:Uncharacterized protein n=1 Tax=Iris pallida TaxID=29817 RepID=A0AAX6DGH9_IRIPA|nr:hypothetical protein M6B38_248265 [Iris pallida]